MTLQKCHSAMRLADRLYESRRIPLDDWVAQYMQVADDLNILLPHTPANVRMVMNMKKLISLSFRAHPGGYTMHLEPCLLDKQSVYVSKHGYVYAPNGTYKGVYNQHTGIYDTDYPDPQLYNNPTHLHT
jgi:hypothetical protein